MSNEQRAEIARQAKFCLRCLDPKVTYKNDHLKVCPTRTQKNRYSCTKCNLHSWVCIKHRSENSVLLQGFADEMTKRNMGFTYIAELHLGIGGANPWTPPTARSLNPGVGPMLTGNYALETGLRLGKQGQDGQGKLPEEVALEAHSPDNPDLPMAEAISQLQKLTPSGEQL